MKAITTAHLEQLEKKRNAACGKLQKFLETKYPVGSHAQVFLNSRQTVPSEGEVVAHSGSEGTVMVRLFKESKWNHQRHVCRIHFSRVVDAGGFS